MTKADSRNDRRALVAFVLLTLVLPIGGFLLLGQNFEQQIVTVVQAAETPWAVAMLVAVTLSADLFLPIPSSVVLTFAGVEIGPVAATVAGAIGLTVSAEIGYWLGRLGGRAIAERVLLADELQRWQAMSATHAWIWLVVSRPLPIIAEAVTVAAGLAKLSHARFLLTMLVANVWIAGAFAVVGSLGGEEYQWGMLVASAILPLGLTVAVNRFASRQQVAE